MLTFHVSLNFLCTLSSIYRYPQWRLPTPPTSWWLPIYCRRPQGSPKFSALIVSNILYSGADHFLQCETLFLTGFYVTVLSCVFFHSLHSLIFCPFTLMVSSSQARTFCSMVLIPLIWWWFLQMLPLILMHQELQTYMSNFSHDIANRYWKSKKYKGDFFFKIFYF